MRAASDCRPPLTARHASQPRTAPATPPSKRTQSTAAPLHGEGGQRRHTAGCGPRPEFLKAVIKDVFKRVAIICILFHPGSFLSIIDSEFGLSDESAGEFAAREQPMELYAEEQKEAVDVTRKVFVRLDRAA